MSDKESDDFVSLWKKKSQAGQPSAVGGLLDKLNKKTSEVAELTKQNEELKEKILKNIDLLNQTETVIKTYKGQISKLEAEKEAGSEKWQVEIANLKTELNETKITLADTEKLINEKDEQIFDLKNKALFTPPSSGASSAGGSEGQVQNKKAKIQEITEINKELMQKIKSLESEVEYLKKPETKEAPSAQLNSLVQDLQNNLNKSKKQIQSLLAENKSLKSGQVQAGGGGEESARVKELEQKNAELLNQIKSLETSKVPAESDNIKSLEEKIKEKDAISSDLKSKPEAAAPAGGGVGISAGLVSDLQNTINKMKAELKKKNKLIADLRK